MLLTIAAMVSLGAGFWFLIHCDDHVFVTEENKTKNKGFKFVILILSLMVIWTFAYIGQREIWANDDQERAEKQAYYDKCIVEVSNSLNNKVVFYSKVDKCANGEVKP